MNDRFFLDTNVIVYSFDSSAPRKQTTAQELIRTALSRQEGCISYQVVQEFLNVATRKFATPLSHQDCNQYLYDVLAPLCEIFPSVELYAQALGNADRWKYSFSDSLIITAALHADCKILYSEDLQHGQAIHGLTITNPFLGRQWA
jgi:predicted nucleic acid-binding protein